MWLRGRIVEVWRPPDADPVPKLVQQLLTLFAAAILETDGFGHGLGAGLGDADRRQELRHSIAKPVLLYFDALNGDGVWHNSAAQHANAIGRLAYHGITDESVIRHVPTDGPYSP